MVDGERLAGGSLWIPYIDGINSTDFAGKKEIFVRPPPAADLRRGLDRDVRMAWQVVSHA